MTTTPTREELERLADYMASRSLSTWSTEQAEAFKAGLELRVPRHWAGLADELAQKDAEERAEYARLYAKYGGVKP